MPATTESKLILRKFALGWGRCSLSCPLVKI